MRHVNQTAPTTKNIPWCFTDEYSVVFRQRSHHQTPGANPGMTQTVNERTEKEEHENHEGGTRPSQTPLIETYEVNNIEVGSHCNEEGNRGRRRRPSVKTTAMMC